ncbi:DUF421 domain-containing protein [Neobacillus sp. OS1-2]|uniref:DUF421 domain-containing protein n=1 Tax=Neobacillus sp. OS1-2 TaxID=3070680 RepID=UPI0027E17AFA|nr:DUF421 domain-containing protein [Neobacillus sp. OS1-2]WML39762.1 DUF421 domain-containing protein [Neobacillus sp. OS1-2]
MSYLVVFVELIIGFIALFITVKSLGKTQISQITPFDFISSLVLGELVGSAIFDEKTGLLKILFAVFVWGALIFITGIVTQKFRPLRNFLEGRPTMLINKGQIDWNELKRNRLDIDQLMQLLRSRDIFSMEDVEYAIFENNGSLSVLRKVEVDYPLNKDLNIQKENNVIPYTVISDGKVIVENLKLAGLNEAWLHMELESHGVKHTKEICYAEWQVGKNLYFQKY